LGSQIVSGFSYQLSEVNVEIKVEVEVEVEVTIED
jgi:hypothetical protein